MKRKIIRYFNQGASTYDSAAEVQTYVAQQLVARLENISAKEILEIGCGTGLLSQQLISLFPDASFLLTDIAPVMVETCQNRFMNQPKIKIACLDGETIAVESKFDLITSSMTLHWFDDVTQGLEKIIDK